MPLHVIFQNQASCIKWLISLTHPKGFISHLWLLPIWTYYPPISVFANYFEASRVIRRVTWVIWFHLQFEFVFDTQWIKWTPRQKSYNGHKSGKLGGHSIAVYPKSKFTSKPTHLKFYIYSDFVPSGDLQYAFAAVLFIHRKSRRYFQSSDDLSITLQSLVQKLYDIIFG